MVSTKFHVQFVDTVYSDDFDKLAPTLQRWPKLKKSKRKSATHNSLITVDTVGEPLEGGRETDTVAAPWRVELDEKRRILPIDFAVKLSKADNLQQWIVGQIQTQCVFAQNWSKNKRNEDHKEGQSASCRYHLLGI